MAIVPNFGLTLFGGNPCEIYLRRLRDQHHQAAERWEEFFGEVE
jgi:hypothetical protein